MLSDNARTREEIERDARHAGLHNLTPQQMDEFAQADAYMRDLVTKIPRDFVVTDEPALIFRASDEAGR